MGRNSASDRERQAYGPVHEPGRRGGRPQRIHKPNGTKPADAVRRYTLQTAVVGARLLGRPGNEI